MGNPNWIDKWSPADLLALVHKRDIEKKTFPQIGIELGQHEASCARRYHQIVALRTPKELRPAPRPRVPLHRQLGIETYVHLQAILHPPFDGRRSGSWLKGQPVYAHWYRMPITLPKVFA